MQYLNPIADQFHHAIYRNVPGYEENIFGMTWNTPRTTVVLQPLSTFVRGLNEIVSKATASMTPGRDSPRVEYMVHRLRTPPHVTPCLVRRTVGSSEEPHVMVLGFVLHELPATSFDRFLLEFLSVAADVFQAQPERLFLHAFLIIGTCMEPWTIDRAGAYSGRTFDIFQSQGVFEEMMTVYAEMTDSQLGLNTHFYRLERETIVDVTSEYDSDKVAYMIEMPALVTQPTLVGPGTSYFMVKSLLLPETELTLKLEWAQELWDKESNILRRINRARVAGVPTLERSGSLSAICSLRSPLQFDRPYRLSSSPGFDAGTPTPYDDMTLYYTITSSVGRPLKEIISATELLVILRDVSVTLRNMYMEMNLIHRNICPESIRIVRDESSSPRMSESEWLSSAPTTKGLLINLGSALTLADLLGEPSPLEAGGFPTYTAVGVLNGGEYTYRHDLESLFYVFLWMAISTDLETGRIPCDSRLQAWKGQEAAGVAAHKVRDMMPGAFDDMVQAEFTPHFRSVIPCAMALRELLFPTRNGTVIMETDLRWEAADAFYTAFTTTLDDWI